MQVKHNTFLKNTRLLAYFFFLIISPFIFYNIFSSIQIPPLPKFVEKNWLIYDEPEYVLKQTLSVVVFSMIILATLLFWRFRVPVAMAGVALMLVGGLVELDILVEYMNMPVIIFLLCMMIIISYIRRLGFFDFILERTMMLTRFEPKVLLVFFVLMSAFMAAAVDEVSSILFMSVLIFDLAKRFDIDPLPYLMCSIFATNIGSSATVLGNPIGVYVAFYANLSFDDFLKWATPAAILSSIVIVPIMFRRYSNFLSSFRLKLSNSLLSDKPPSISRDAENGGIIFTFTLIMLALHHTLESFFLLPKNSLLVAIPLAIASYILISLKDEAVEFFEKNVEWWTLVYFMFLFSISSTLEFTGVTAKISLLFINLYNMISVFLPPQMLIAVFFLICVVIIGMLSSFLDNIVAVAIFLPIISEIVSLDIPFAEMLWWSTLIGGCYFGNATPIGSTANIVVLGLFDKRYGKSIPFIQWFKIGLVISLLTSLVASMYVLAVGFLAV
ncbi:MAG: SLC13 family permease [Nitrososphaeria archaeon]